MKERGIHNGLNISAASIRFAFRPTSEARTNELGCSGWIYESLLTDSFVIHHRRLSLGAAPRRAHNRWRPANLRRRLKPIRDRRRSAVGRFERLLGRPRRASLFGPPLGAITLRRWTTALCKLRLCWAAHRRGISDQIMSSRDNVSTPPNESGAASGPSKAVESNRWSP